MNDIIKKSKRYCKHLLAQGRCSRLPFHNEEHTMEVFRNVKRIGRYENLSQKELEPALLAALFHDTGNTVSFRGHEDFSKIEARHFLAANDYPIPRTTEVLGCIDATRMPQEPRNRLEKIICDADLFHLGSKFYEHKSHLLRREWAKYLKLEYSDEEWNAMNIDFLRQHHFYTAYGKQVLEPVKERNLKELILSVEQNK